MKANRRLTRYMLIISILSSLGVWFCTSTSCIKIQNHLLEFKIFSAFIGKRSIVIDILLSISVTAWFAAGGFLIDYFNKKSQAKKDIIQMYKTIRKRCFHNILFNDNYYKYNYDEVSSILEYLYEKKSMVMDYQAPLLKLYVKICKFIKAKQGKAEPTTFHKDNKYALIIAIYTTLLNYFVPVNIIQTEIRTTEKIITLC